MFLTADIKHLNTSCSYGNRVNLGREEEQVVSRLQKKTTLYLSQEPNVHKKSPVHKWY